MEPQGDARNGRPLAAPRVLFAQGPGLPDQPLAPAASARREQHVEAILLCPRRSAAGWPGQGGRRPVGSQAAAPWQGAVRNPGRGGEQAKSNRGPAVLVGALAGLHNVNAVFKAWRAVRAQGATTAPPAKKPSSPLPGPSGVPSQTLTLLCRRRMTGPRRALTSSMPLARTAPRSCAGSTARNCAAQKRPPRRRRRASKTGGPASAWPSVTWPRLAKQRSRRQWARVNTLTTHLPLVFERAAFFLKKGGRETSPTNALPSRAQPAFFFLLFLSSGTTTTEIPPGGSGTVSEGVTSRGTRAWASWMFGQAPPESIRPSAPLCRSAQASA